MLSINSLIVYKLLYYIVVLYPGSKQIVLKNLVYYYVFLAAWDRASNSVLIFDIIIIHCFNTFQFIILLNSWNTYLCELLRVSGLLIKNILLDAWKIVLLVSVSSYTVVSILRIFSILKSNLIANHLVATRYLITFFTNFIYLNKRLVRCLENFNNI
jgi:hypothetical protein